MEEQKIEVVLKDHAEGAEGECTIKVVGGSQFIEIYAKGYGHAEMEDGHGSCVALEFYNGELRLIVNNDITISDPNIISLEGAREDKRPPEVEQPTF